MEHQKRKNSVFSIIEYIKIYETYLGKKIYAILLLSFLASITEGLGFLACRQRCTPRITMCLDHCLELSLDERL